MTGPAVDGELCMQLSPLKLLCGAKGGEDNPDESRPTDKFLSSKLFNFTNNVETIFLNKCFMELFLPDISRYV